ncbi:hypothetical protein [Gulosibacter chungangensis]|uniref:Uncharacterized protein n=1 Tax=Gulosibacter chungangensis TaxID=979746 RepID=A0A7J5BBR3_9MICO|nr:hypothetical protein [Gulosibacter chungangensis]KAB1643545.1 hypothetical protein F8O05_06575 [Gulosibacter chungangensis]
MADFFDDPDFAEQMARQGIRHQPGMSAELLEQLAPLLKAEGVDLDDPDNPPNLETLNAAMAVAVERHNMHLHTPVGRHRDLALAMLREIAVAIAEGDSDTAVDLFDSIQPEETDVRPAASHVIGVSLGLLDEWFADQSIQRDVLRATVPKLFSKPSRNVARDLLSLAIKGRATGSLDQLIRRNGGLVVTEAGALAVAGALIARAKGAGVSVAELGGQVLTAIELPVNSGGPAFLTEPVADIDWEAVQREPLLRGLREWLDGEDFLPSEADGVLQTLVTIFSAMRRHHRPIEKPADVEMLSKHLDEFVEGFGPLDDIELAIDTLLHYQMARAEAAAEWGQIHDEPDGTVTLDMELGALTKDAEEHTNALPDEERMSAFTRTRLYSATREFIHWVGDRGQSVTSTGVLRRADIATVAGMLGIEAVGVAKLPPAGEAGGVRHVKSMLDIPELVIWWDALKAGQIIEVTKTRVRLGRQGQRLHAGEPWTTSVMDSMIEGGVEMGVANFCIDEGFDSGYGKDGSARVMFLIAATHGAIRHAPSIDTSEIDPETFERIDHTKQLFGPLCSLGIFEQNGKDVAVPVAWGGPVARGLLQGVTRDYVE